MGGARWRGVARYVIWEAQRRGGAPKTHPATLKIKKTTKKVSIRFC